MACIFWVNGERFVATRTFQFTHHPSIMEVEGAFYYYGSHDPVKRRDELERLPEPHRQRALDWFDGGSKPSEEPEVVEIIEEKGFPKVKMHLCPDCAMTNQSREFPTEAKLKAHIRKEHKRKV